MVHRAVVAFAVSLAISSVPAGRTQRQPLSGTDIGDIAVLLKMEDTRQFDKAELGRILGSKHPEVRRRAAVSTTA